MHKWSPPAFLTNDVNFIKDKPHGCTECVLKHGNLPHGLECFCRNCTRGPENDLEIRLHEWVKRGSPINCMGEVDFRAEPYPVNVTIAREFGLQFCVHDPALVQRDWSEYHFVKATALNADRIQFKHVVRHVDEFHVILERVPMFLQPFVEYQLVKK
jgi:hypothetical protein